MPTHLSTDEVKYIFSTGLYDIKELVKKINEDGTGGYIYEISSKYKMPEKFYQTLQEDFKVKEEQHHFQSAEENINDLPLEAFENAPTSDNPINSLDF